MDKRLDAMADGLEAVMGRAIEAHERLHSLMRRKREAFARADTGRMTELLQLENEQVKAIADLERKRLELVAQMTLVVEPGASEPLRMRELAERCEEPLRGRLLAMRQRLEAKLQEVKAEASVARRAAESLARHVRGLVQTIGAISSGAAAYGRAGRVPEPAATIRTLNVTA